MARAAYDGMVRVHVVATIANIAAPTVAEINAGTNISNFVPKDGLTPPGTQNYVDNSSLAETFDAQVVGSFGGAITVIGIRDFATDTFWDLVVYGTNTHLVVRRGIAVATAFAATQKVEVYPIQWQEPLPLQTATNELQKFSAGAAVRSQPNMKAVVA
jgi:hypothetical protein